MSRFFKETAESQRKRQNPHTVLTTSACNGSKQVANLRIHYSRKVKELSDKLEEASKPEVLGRNKLSTDSMGPPSRVITTRLIQPVNFSLRSFHFVTDMNLEYQFTIILQGYCTDYRSAQICQRFIV